MRSVGGPRFQDLRNDMGYEIYSKKTQIMLDFWIKSSSTRWVLHSFSNNLTYAIISNEFAIDARVLNA